MKIVIESIPHDEMRYDTSGDYWLDAEGTLQVRVSRLSNPLHEQALAIHELWEALMAMARDIDFADIDSWDTHYEASRAPGDDSEPGDHPDCPYHVAHRLASAIEEEFLRSVYSSWLLYEQALDALRWRKKDAVD